MTRINGNNQMLNWMDGHTAHTHTHSHAHITLNQCNRCVHAMTSHHDRYDETMHCFIMLFCQSPYQFWCGKVAMMVTAMIAIEIRQPAPLMMRYYEHSMDMHSIDHDPHDTWD